MRLGLWCSILVAFPPLIFREGQPWGTGAEEGKPLPSGCQALRFPGGGGVQQLLADSALAQARGVRVGQAGLGERVWVVLSQGGVVLSQVLALGREGAFLGLTASGSGRTGLALPVDLGRLF